MIGVRRFEGERENRGLRILMFTDAWRPQVNGVVHTLEQLAEALKPFGLEREIVTFVGGFSSALTFARASDLIATVPEKHTGNLRAGMFSFPLPVPAPEMTVSMLWHPRRDADTAHRWLRACLLEVCSEHSVDTAKREALSVDSEA